MEEENHTFPLLSSEEILCAAFLNGAPFSQATRDRAITKEAGIPLTAKNLAVRPLVWQRSGQDFELRQNPTPDVTSSVYEGFVQVSRHPPHGGFQH